MNMKWTINEEMFELDISLHVSDYACGAYIELWEWVASFWDAINFKSTKYLYQASWTS